MLPIIKFDLTMSGNERQIAINQLNVSLNESKETSHAKRDILVRIINYANQNLVAGLSLFGGPSADRFATCQRIFAQVNLPDLLFLQYTYNQLSSITDTNSQLRDGLLGYVNAYRQAHLQRVTEQMQNISFGLGGLFLVMREPSYVLVAALMYLCSPGLAQLRVNSVLESRLARQLAGDSTNLEDGWDEMLLRGSALAGRGIRAGAQRALTFFEQKIHMLEGVPARRELPEAKEHSVKSLQAKK